MNKVVSARTMRRIDQQASRDYAIPPIVLMENAAIAGAFCALKMLKVGQTSVTVFCGQGNNGGDGFACARHLINRGLKVKTYFLGQEKKLSPEAKTNYRILTKIKGVILPPGHSSLNRQLAKTDLIIDALLGIGVKGKLRAPYAKLIERINRARRPVLSLDIPSGLDATSGEAPGIAVAATRTVTFGLLKRGLLVSGARRYTGELTVAEISLPRALLV